MNRPTLIALCLLPVLGCAADASAETILGTTCDGATSTIEELTFGVYRLSGPDRTYPGQVTYPASTSVTLSNSPVPQTLAVCDEAPGPRAHCRAISVDTNSTGTLPISTTQVTPAATWIVVDSPVNCGSFSLIITGPVGG